LEYLKRRQIDKFDSTFKTVKRTEVNTCRQTIPFPYINYSLTEKCRSDCIFWRIVTFWLLCPINTLTYLLTFHSSQSAYHHRRRAIICFRHEQSMCPKNGMPAMGILEAIIAIGFGVFLRKCLVTYIVWGPMVHL